MEEITYSNLWENMPIRFLVGHKTQQGRGRLQRSPPPAGQAGSEVGNDVFLLSTQINLHNLWKHQ